MTSRKRSRCASSTRWLIAAVVALGTSAPHAAELIVGETRAGDAPSVPFRILGGSRANVLGGAITLGTSQFTIQRVSRRGLIGGARLAGEGDTSYAEYAVFSSSFSEQTAVGQPWVAARRYHHCDEPYNSFVAVYRVNGEKAVKALGSVPYPALIDDVERSDEATVYCFMSARGADG